MKKFLIPFLLVICFTPTVAAQPTDDEIGELSTFFVLFPELRNLPKPEFLSSGTRVTYAAGGASPGSAGGGFVQYDVVATDPQNVMVRQHSYSDVVVGLQAISQTPAQGAPGLGPFWINPTVLAQAEAVASPTLSVTRVEKQVAGASRRVVRFQTQTTTGRTVYEFSEASGLMTFSSISSGGGDAQLVLVSTRELARPWQASATPGWARPGAVLEYTGTNTTTIEGRPAPAQSVSATITVDRSTDRWSIFDEVTTQQNFGSAMARSITGVAQQTGGLWLPTSALQAELSSQPQVVDRDPTTGATVEVSAGDGAIILTQTLAASATTWIYNANLGVLEQQVSRVQTVNGFQEIVLSRTGGSNLEELAEQGPLPAVEEPDPQDPGPGTGTGSGGGKSSSGGCSSAHPSTSPVSLLLGLLMLWPRRRLRSSPVY